jgi:hypothetical protein
MLASQLRDSIGFSSVQPDADKHSKDKPSVPEPRGLLQQPASPLRLVRAWRPVQPMRLDFFIRIPAGVKSCRKGQLMLSTGWGELVNNVFIRLTALVTVLAHPGTAFANHGIVPIAASAAPA